MTFTIKEEQQEQYAIVANFLHILNINRLLSSKQPVLVLIIQCVGWGSKSQITQCSNKKSIVYLVVGCWIALSGIEP